MDSERRFRSQRAQTSVIGVVLIIGLTLAAASAVVVFGSGAIDDGRHHSRVGQAEQAMTQFDSRTAQVALGDSDVQTIRMGQGEGSYRVNESAGRIRLYHEDWNGTNTTSDEDIYEAPLGAVVYESGGTTIAYQGGGVWRRDKGGGAKMVSPPELHNRKATLTLPVVRVLGSGSASGQQQATVRSVARSEPIFPDLKGERTPRSEQYSNSSERYYENPVTKGNMTVEIESEYCEAWRRYFLTRTEGSVDDCSDGVVTAQIVSLGAQGNFDIAGAGELSVRGIEEMKVFQIRMEASHRGASSFNRLNWTMSTQSEDEEFHIKFEKKDGTSIDCGNSVYGEVYYSNETVTQKWVNNTEFTLWGPQCPDKKDDLYLEVDLLNTSINMTSRGDAVTVEDGTTYTDSAPLGVLVEYYFEKIESMDLSIDEGNNAYLSDTSSGKIEYEGGGQVVTFLHVTENEVKVSFD